MKWTACTPSHDTNKLNWLNGNITSEMVKLLQSWAFSAVCSESSTSIWNHKSNLSYAGQTQTLNFLYFSSFLTIASGIRIFFLLSMIRCFFLDLFCSIHLRHKQTKSTNTLFSKKAALPLFVSQLCSSCSTAKDSLAFTHYQEHRSLSYAELFQISFLAFFGVHSGLSMTAFTFLPHLSFCFVAFPLIAFRTTSLLESSSPLALALCFYPSSVIHQ